VWDLRVWSLETNRGEGEKEKVEKKKQFPVSGVAAQPLRLDGHRVGAGCLAGEEEQSERRGI